MANVDENLMARTTLRGDDEARAAERKLIAEKSEAANINSAGGKGTDNQQKSKGRNTKEQGVGIEAPSRDGGVSAAAAATNKALSFSWENMLDPFAIPFALAYINIHVFGHSVFGEKVFGKLGEEWIPNNMRTGVYAATFQSKARKFGLIETVVLAILDLVALFALMIAIVLIMWATHPWSTAVKVVGNAVGNAVGINGDQSQ